MTRLGVIIKDFIDVHLDTACTRNFTDRSKFSSRVRFINNVKTKIYIVLLYDF